MRFVRVLLVGVFACGTLLLLAPGAEAAKDRKSSAKKACKTLTSLQQDLDAVDPTDSDRFDATAFAGTAEAFHKAARKAPKRVKSSLETLGDFYEALSDADSSVEALQEYGERGEQFSKAITKFSTFYATACGSTSSTAAARATAS